MALAACAGGNPGETTCDEYAAMTYNERSDLDESLLKAHGLDPNSISNIAGLNDAIAEFCGSHMGGVLVGQEDTATRNNSEPLENAVDWESDSW